jgi:hypothetical protein
MFGFRAATQTTLADLDRLTIVGRLLTKAGFDGFFPARRKR